MRRPDLVDKREAAEIAGISVSTLQSHRYPGEHSRKTPFPAPVAHYGRVPVWRRRDIEQWAANRDSSVGRRKKT